MLFLLADTCLSQLLFVITYFLRTRYFSRAAITLSLHFAGLAFDERQFLQHQYW